MPTRSLISLPPPAIDREAAGGFDEGRRNWDYMRRENGVEVIESRGRFWWEGKKKTGPRVYGPYEKKGAAVMRKAIGEGRKGAAAAVRKLKKGRLNAGRDESFDLSILG